jgi:hypothetical protein
VVDRWLFSRWLLSGHNVVGRSLLSGQNVVAKWLLSGL